VVWKLDRLSRSLRGVLVIMEALAEIKAGFRSLTEVIDTTTAAGRMMMQMVGSFAEFERAMLKERTKAGLDAHQDGRIGGRRPKLTHQQQAEIKKMVAEGGKTTADAALLFNAKIDQKDPNLTAIARIHCSRSIQNGQTARKR